MTTYRVLIVDDHPVVRDGLAARLSNETDLAVCGEADDEHSAMEQLARLAPDLVIVDISLGSGNGLNLAKRIRKAAPSTILLIHSMHDERVYAERSLRAGAQGYLSKAAPREALLDAIRTVLSGRTYLSPEATERLIRRTVSASPAPGESPLVALSDRELEVLNLLGQGLGTREVADALNLSPHTIETYREKLKSKLGLASGAELTRYAVQTVLENT